MPCLGALTMMFELRVIKDEEEDMAFRETPSVPSPAWSKSSSGWEMVVELSLLACSLFKAISERLSGRSDVLLLD